MNVSAQNSTASSPCRSISSPTIGAAGCINATIKWEYTLIQAISGRPSEVRTFNTKEAAAHDVVNEYSKKYSNSYSLQTSPTTYTVYSGKFYSNDCLKETEAVDNGYTTYELYQGEFAVMAEGYADKICAGGLVRRQYISMRGADVALRVYCPEGYRKAMYQNTGAPNYGNVCPHQFLGWVRNSALMFSEVTKS